MKKPFFSIVIPLKEPNDYLKEAVEHCLQLDYKDYEILVLPNQPAKIKGVRVVPTYTKILPAEKRDIALRHAKGDVLAFLDDDAFPRKDWLKNAAKYFSDSDVAAIGGPALTPPSDSLFQKAGGYVLGSRMGGGSYTYRYLPEEKREVDDYPTVNLFVRKSVFKKIGGFDTKYWPGEDTKLCLDIVGLGKKIVYAPDVVVYHHRRPLFIPHLKQIGDYGLHRGFFAKKFPKTSFRFSYFLPSLFLLGLVAGPFLSLLCPFLWLPYAAVVLIYSLAALFYAVLSGVQENSFSITPLVFLGIILTHLVYGFGFLKGLASSDLKR
ncbi:glycosyltransferase [Candidatus Micrarchaeota archaeon]|nr:glycosyltransferase [Candidatus Micrarchaeota archaeon]